MLTEYLPLPGDTPIIFWHPQIAQQLTIQTGVSGISWEYALNLNVTPTFGGEVTQVLSSYIGPVTVHGQTRDNKQLRDIYTWFLHYMQIAGLRARSEEYVVMNYPTRGWSFWIMPNQLPNFLIDRDEIAVEWTVTAEVVADDGGSYDILQGMSMKGFWEASFDPSMFDVGFTGYNDPRNVSPLDASAGQRIGDNMQSLIGSWASGDFMHFAVDTGHRTNTSQGLKSATDYWDQILGGSDVLIGSKGSGSTTTNANGVGGSAADLSNAQNTFASGLAEQTGLSFPVCAAWVKAEGNGGGDFNELNVSAQSNGKSYSGVPEASNQHGQFSSFVNVADAVKETAFWINTFSNFRSIKAAAGGSDQAQLSAIWHSAWDAGHYGGNGQNLIAAYNAVEAAGVTVSGNGLGAKASAIALAQVGTPYVYGGDSPRTGFDCSGLCYYSYTKAGAPSTFPRTSEAQFNSGWESIKVGALQPGDLLFEITDGSASQPGHVSMFVGNGTAVEAMHTGTLVTKETVEAFTGRSDYIGARRPKS